MKHLILWLYIMTFMVGIVVMTLGSIFYVKNRIDAVKYIIFADLFLALSLFLDTFNKKRERGLSFPNIIPKLLRR